MSGPTSAQLVAAIPHLTYRQLDWWARQGYLGEAAQVLTGSGHQRHYTPEEVLQARHMAHLCNVLGVSPETAARMGSEAIRYWSSGEWTWRAEDQGVYVVWWLPKSLTEQFEDVLVVEQQHLGRIP